LCCLHCSAAGGPSLSLPSFRRVASILKELKKKRIADEDEEKKRSLYNGRDVIKQWRHMCGTSSFFFFFFLLSIQKKKKDFLFSDCCCCRLVE
jgi:hypothetical protein